MPNKTSEVKNQNAKSRKKSAVSEADEINKAAESDVNGYERRRRSSR